MMDGGKTKIFIKFLNLTKNITDRNVTKQNEIIFNQN